MAIPLYLSALRPLEAADVRITFGSGRPKEELAAVNLEAHEKRTFCALEFWDPIINMMNDIILRTH